MENGTKRPRRPVKAKASGMWKKMRYAIVILFALALVQQVYTIYSLHQEKQQLEQQLQELKKENESLSEQKKLLEDDKHIEGVAREELGLVKPGEVPYVR
jgi:cell division protein ftsL